MTLQRNRHRQERRRRLLSVLLKAGLLGGALAVTAFYSYNTALFLSDDKVAALEARVRSLEENAAADREEAQTLRAALEDSRRAAERYRVVAEQAPRGEDARELLRLVQSKLGAGMGKDRLATYIAAAQAPKKCSEPFTRRFTPKVRGAKGEAATVKLADGLILSASGIPAKDAGGRDEHWYDPAKPVTLIIAEPDGNRTETTGPLPLEHMLVLKGSEYRFTVTPAQRGFISVAIDRCEMVNG